jgi:GNAT superfamily N-acetyltransferase
VIVLAPDCVVPLDPAHDREPFDCGVEPLNRYLKQQARQDLEKRVAAPFVLLESNTLVVRGYYTLSASVIALNDLPEGQKKKLPRYAQLPVTLIGRLARDKSISTKGVGEFLLMDALARCLKHAAQIAAMAVVVDAKDDAAERFYLHFDFLPFQQTPRRLFLPMAQIAALFS